MFILFRYELREDRKRESARTTGHIDNLKREILRSIRASSMGQILPEIPPPQPIQHQYSGDNMSYGGIGGSMGPGGGMLSPTDIDILKQEIVGSLRQEIRELAREMAMSLHRQGSPVNPNPSLIPPPPPPSDLYQTHLYTQLWYTITIIIMQWKINVQLRWCVEGCSHWNS